MPKILKIPENTKILNPKSTEGLEHPDYYFINLADCKDSRDSKYSKDLDS